MDIESNTVLNDNNPDTGNASGKLDFSDCPHINPDTYLATDFLNHFNEIIMLVEMLPQLDDVYADIVAWEAISYEQHFQLTGFAYSPLAIEAYKQAPKEIREKFDALISDINHTIIAGRQEIIEAFEKEDREALIYKSLQITNDLRSMIDKASAIINGSYKSAQDQADTIFESL